MNKEKFNELELIEQIEYINHKLKENSLTKICEEVGIARSTIRGRFKKLGYELIDNQYIKVTDITDITVITKNAPVTKPSNNSELEARMNKFEHEIEQIKNLLKSTIITDSNITKSTTITNKDNNKINIYTNEPVTRQFRVDAEVQKRFKAFCKANSEHRISDMISQALEEFMDKFE